MRFVQSTSYVVLVLPVLASASGPCTASDSLSWPPVGDCATPGKFDTLVQNCRACCMNDEPCLQACLKAGGLNRRSMTGETPLWFVQEARGLNKRIIGLNCAVNEGCYKFTDGSLLCLNLGTGLYHDDVGGNGSYYSGMYTGPDGKVQTGTSTATATDTSMKSSSSPTAQGTRSTARIQTTSTTSASASASPTVASAPASPAVAPTMAGLGNHGFFKAGILGLAVGFAL